MFLVFRFLKFLSAKLGFYYYNGNLKLKKSNENVGIHSKDSTFQILNFRLAVTKDNLMSGRSFSLLPLILS